MAEPLTDAELAAMRDHCEAATPEPWVSVSYGIYNPALPREYLLMGNQGHPDTPANQVFAATARSDMPRLLDEVARLRAFILEQKQDDWSR